MELRHLRYFVAAAQEANFGRAAERIGISRPGLGLQIRELEDELGVELFERLPRGLRLTVAGTMFLADVRRVLGDLETAIERAQDAGRGKEGILRVGHVPMSLLPGSRSSSTIPTFCVRYPNVDVRCMALNAAEQCASLDEGRLDVGIVYAPPKTTGDIRSETLDEMLLDGALLPSTHPLAQKSPLHCRDLCVLPLLQGPAATDPYGHDWVSRALRARGLEVQIKDECQITDPVVRVSLVATGAGWMAGSAATAGALLADTTGVVFRKWSDPPISYPCCVLWRPSDRSALVANFLSVCRELRDGATSDLPSQPKLVWPHRVR